VSETLYTIPGINDDGRDTTSRLGRIITDSMSWELQTADYLVSRLWDARFRNYNTLAAMYLWRELDPDKPINLLGHSHGCLLIIRMLEIAAEKDYDVPEIKSVIMLAPAADRNAHTFEDWRYSRALVIYNPLDIAIWWGSMNPFHPFGTAGARSFKTKDPRVTQVRRTSRRGWWNHTKPYFGDKKIQGTANTCVKFLSTGDV